MKKCILFLLCTILLTLSYGVTDSFAATKKETINFKNGAVYYGDVKNGKPHGKGTMKWPGNKSYSGDWSNGKRSGQGKYTAYLIENDTEIYKKYNGTWKNDTYNGQGEYVEFTKINSSGYIVEDNVLATAMSGKFVNGIFISGYQFNSSYMSHQFSFKDEKSTVMFMSYPDENNINSLLLKKFNQFSAGYLEIKNKQSNGLLKGYLYYAGMEEDRQELSEGYFKDGELYTGVKYMNNDLHDGYIISNIKTGKVVSSKEIFGVEDLPVIIDAKLDKHSKDLTPYIGGFKKVYNLAQSEKKNINKYQPTTTTDNKSVGKPEDFDPNKFNLKDYEGTWEHVETSDYYDYDGDKSIKAYIDSITITATSDSEGTVYVESVQTLDGGLYRAAGVESKIKVGPDKVVIFDYEDDGNEHTGSVTIAFTDKGIDVKTTHKGWVIVNEDETVYESHGGDWSVFEEKFFPWESKVTNSTE